MQLISTSTTSASSSSSSSSSHSSGGQHSERKAMDSMFERMQDCPLPPTTHFKARKRHPHRHRHPHPPLHLHPYPHFNHSPPLHPHPHHHSAEIRHYSPSPPHHFVELRHYSPPLPPPPAPPRSSPHRHERAAGQLLRVKPPKHLKKKVRKLHHLLMKSCKLPKGGRHGHKRHHILHFPPALEGGFCGQHPPGCCLQLHTEDCRPAKERYGHHFRPHSPHHHHHHHHHRHKRSPMRQPIRSEVVALGSPCMAEPPREAGAPPLTTTDPAADEAAPSIQLAP